MDADLVSIQEARDALHAAHAAQKQYKTASQKTVDRIVDAMVEAGIREARRLGQLAHDETGFGKPESKTQKNLFATRTLRERMQGMKTVGVIAKSHDGAVWEVATPMGVVGALVPSTNPTSTAMYKAILAAKARCGIVMSPHPSAVHCTAEALRVVAGAAVEAGAPEGLFHSLTKVTLAGTNELLEHDLTDVILATGGSAMVKAAYSKGKPAYGVGSGNVPAYVDRSADVQKAARDIITGVSFDWGTLCSTERSVIADSPIRSALVEAMQAEGAHLCSETETEKLRQVVKKDGRLNVKVVGQSPETIAQLAGFSVPTRTKALVAPVEAAGAEEPLSMETLSPLLSLYVADGWEAGCARCIEILEFGGIGHTLALHATSDRVIEQFALKKPAMRIVVNTVGALGSVGMTTSLFPAMTLGPGTIGGSIVSDNLSPMHLVNVKRVAFETHPLEEEGSTHRSLSSSAGDAPRGEGWMEKIDRRLVARAGNAPLSTSSVVRHGASEKTTSGDSAPRAASVRSSIRPMPDDQVTNLIKKFRK